jgi:DNA-binding transcriptional MocR family regulator
MSIDHRPSIMPEMALTIHSQSGMNGPMQAPPDVSSADLSRLLGSWKGRGPAYQRLAGVVRSLVLDGRLPLRARLPSERVLAVALGVSRTTTTGAYDLLRSEGYIESLRGSGSRIALPAPSALERELPTGEGEQPSAESLDMTIAALPAPGAMMESVLRATHDLSAHLGGSGYEPSGLRSLRTVVASQFTARGLQTDEDQIVITSGAQAALALVLGVLAAPGDPVLVEEPSYPNAFEALRRARARMIPVPMADDGWDLDRIQASFRRASPRLGYMICDFQNPTGFLMTEGQRGSLVAAAERSGAHLVVDETFARLDLEPWREMPEPVAIHDRQGRVVTIGSMSKAYWGGLRIGWIRCVAPLARRLARARVGLDLATPVLEQLVAQHLLGAGEDVLAERRSLLTERRDTLSFALRRTLPTWRFTVPRGGLCLWVDVGHGESNQLTEAADAEGVRLIPGTTFSATGALDSRVRLPFTQPPDVLEGAVTRLAAAERRRQGNRVTG